MDHIDEAIVEMLEIDGRLTHLQLARALGLSRSTTAARLQRLLGSGQVSVRGVVHPSVLGHESLAHVSLELSGRASDVAQEIARRDDAPFVTVTTGRHGVVAELRAGSPSQIDRAIGQLRALPHVHSVETLTYTEVLRDVVGPVGDVTGKVDATDRALLRRLQEDGRASFVELAQSVGLSAAGARRRVIRLLEERLVRVGALVCQSGQDHQSRLGLGLNLAGDHDDIVPALAGMPQVTFAARTLGRFDALVSLRTFSVGELAVTVDAVRDLPGVSAVETWAHLLVVKEMYSQLRLGDPHRPDRSN